MQYGESYHQTATNTEATVIQFYINFNEDVGDLSPPITIQALRGQETSVRPIERAALLTGLQLQPTSPRSETERESTPGLAAHPPDGTGIRSPDTTVPRQCPKSSTAESRLRVVVGGSQGGNPGARGGAPRCGCKREGRWNGGRSTGRHHEG